LDELDTPCLLVDLDALEHNFGIVAETYRDTTCKMRAHTKNVKSPLLAHMQIRAGGTLGGVCTAKVSEAEVMVEGGIYDILIANQVVARDKIVRLCALARQADMKVCVDDPRNVRDLSEIAEHGGVTVGVLVEVDTSMGRAGVRRIEDAVELAKLAVGLPGLKFRGVMSHQFVPGSPDRETRMLEGRRYIQMCLDVKSAIEDTGIPVEIVSSGETFTYDVAPQVEGVTEVEGGTYALMSTGFEYMTEFQIAGKVLGTVISTPRPGVAVGDVGTRAMSSPSEGWPAVEGVPGVTVENFLEDHIVLRGKDAMPLDVGDKFILLPSHQDMLVNRWDQYIAVRNGVVEHVWDIPGRGCVH
jgi:3-hydroxy-D-aspartate aldolase